MYEHIESCAELTWFLLGCPFVTLFYACHILWTMHARVLKFHIDSSWKSSWPVFLYPPAFMLRVYRFCLSFCLFVRSCIRHVHGIYDKVCHRVAWKIVMCGISHEPLIRKHSYLDHRYPGGSVFNPWLLTPGSMSQGEARGQNLGHL